MKKCFVVMPFADQYNGIWIDVIKPTVDAIGHQCVRGDSIFSPGSVLEDIFQQLNTADFIIADLTVPNPNVYYELGYAHALSKKTILITQDINSLPFDLRHQRIIKYVDSASGAVKLKAELTIFINNI